MNEEDKVLEEKDLSPETLTKLNEYKEIISQKLNNFLENIPEGSLLENPSSRIKFKINKPHHHYYRIEVLSDQTLNSLILNTETGSSAIEINRPGKTRDEFLGLIDANSFGGGTGIQVELGKIRITGSFESFKVRMDKIANDIINSIPYTEGS